MNWKHVATATLVLATLGACGDSGDAGVGTSSTGFGGTGPTGTTTGPGSVGGTTTAGTAGQTSGGGTTASTTGGGGSTTATTTGTTGGGASTTGDGASTTGDGATTTGDGTTTTGDGTTTTGGDAGATTGAAALGCRAPEPNPSAGNECHGAPPAGLKLTEVASGLREPTFLAHAPGDPTRLFVTERRGVIRLIKDGALVSTPFLDLSSKVMTSGIGGERGLLGLAFAPDYAQSRRFWVNYSANASRGGTVVASFVANADGDTADLSSESELFTESQPAGNHNGGMLAFGPDGCLYIAMGDGGGANDTYGHGQNDSTALGGILRVDVEQASAGGKAPGNSLSHPHLWSYGLRNPWRFSFDSESGDMYIGDVGQGAWEEVDVEPRGVAGRNYGWPCMEGESSGPGRGCSSGGDLTPPVAVQRTGSNQSVIGGYVYRGEAIPSLVGRYLYADYNSRKIWSFTWQGDGQICDEHELTSQLDTGGSISSFGEDESGELYIVVYNRGRVLRIDPA